MKEWSLEFDLRHPWRPQRAEDMAFQILEELADRGAVASVGPKVLTVRFNVKARDAGGALEEAQKLLRTALRHAQAPQEVFGLQTIVHVELETVDEQERRLGEPTLPPFAGVTEVAEILGITRQRAHQLSQTADFPKPIAALAAGPIWNRHAIDRFKERWTRKPGRPRINVLDDHFEETLPDIRPLVRAAKKARSR